jgi:hypothetical protein
MVSLSEVPVIPGQLRRWNNDEDEDVGTLFLVIGPGEDDNINHAGKLTWQILQNGVVFNWTPETIRNWSEVVDG